VATKWRLGQRAEITMQLATNGTYCSSTSLLCISKKNGKKVRLRYLLRELPYIPYRSPSSRHTAHEHGERFLLEDRASVNMVVIRSSVMSSDLHARTRPAFDKTLATTTITLIAPTYHT
jgi:hypothetical protein